MRTQILLVALMVVLIVIFSALNWSNLNAPATINLLVTDVQGPIGLVVLMLSAVLIALFVLLVISLQANVLLEAKRHSRELSAQRELADKAEASRFTELNQMLQQEFSALRGQVGKPGEVLARLDSVQESLHKELQDSGNTLAAYIGELENRLEDSQVLRPDGTQTTRTG
jgi:hypothetical protein